jgi:hypothetical protein
VPILSDTQNAHPFGCPVYVLKSKLQQGQKISKWDGRANLGVYLGTSAIHANSVGLVLSLLLGLVSPSFHNAYDNKFITISSPFGKYVPKSQWQIKRGFNDDPNLMNLTMQPTFNQQSEPMENSQPHNSNIHDDNANTNIQENHHDNQVSEGGGDYVNNVQPIESIYEGPGTYDPINDTTQNVTQVEESKGQELSKQTVTRSGRVSRKSRKYDGRVSYSSWMDHVDFQATSDPDAFYYHQVLNVPDKQKLNNTTIVIIGYRSNNQQYHQHCVYCRVPGQCAAIVTLLQARF